MRFTLLTLLAFTALVAVALVTICRPYAAVAEFLRTFVILSGCASLVVGFFSAGRTRRFTLTYGVFSLVSLILDACPPALPRWIEQTVPYAAPATGAPTYSGGGINMAAYQAAGVVVELVRYWFAVFVAIIAGAIAAEIWSSDKNSSR